MPSLEELKDLLPTLNENNTTTKKNNETNLQPSQLLENYQNKDDKPQEMGDEGIQSINNSLGRELSSYLPPKQLNQPFQQSQQFQQSQSSHKHTIEEEETKNDDDDGGIMKLLDDLQDEIVEMKRNSSSLTRDLIQSRIHQLLISSNKQDEIRRENQDLSNYNSHKNEEEEEEKKSILMLKYENLV